MDLKSSLVTFKVQNDAGTVSVPSNKSEKEGFYESSRNFRMTERPPAVGGVNAGGSGNSGTFSGVPADKH